MIGFAVRMIAALPKDWSRQPPRRCPSGKLSTVSSDKFLRVRGERGGRVTDCLAVLEAEEAMIGRGKAILRLGDVGNLLGRG